MYLLLSVSVDRRALFLSKLQAPPSPSATTTPSTPPDSPAIFHYTLPSPGLNSPLSLFDAVHDTSEATGIEPWTEEVDFRQQYDAKHRSKSNVSSLRARFSIAVPASNKSLPSLDQITAHLSSHGHMPTSAPSDVPKPRAAMRLPAFLQRKLTQAPASTEPVTSAELAVPPHRLRTDVGRLKPVRPLSLYISASKPLAKAEGPMSASIPTIAITTPTTAADVTDRFDLASRMLTKLQRRTQLPAASDFGKERRRRSAPPELQQGYARAGFMHPVLAMPGGF